MVAIRFNKSQECMNNKETKKPAENSADKNKFM
jgi:hypothetical protein